jgi:hypothetical protein
LFFALLKTTQQRQIAEELQEYVDGLIGLRAGV